MSRNEYDATNDTLSLIAGRETVDTGLSSTSSNPVRNSALYTEFQKTYRDSDTLENALADSDNFPFYDISANAKRKTVWSNICEKIKTVVAKTGGYTTLADTIAAGTTFNNAIGTLLNNDRTIEAYLPILAMSKGRGRITDALSIDTSAAQASANRVGYVESSNTSSLPSDCYIGIREVFYYNSALVWVRITGLTPNNDFCEWGNVYLNGAWRGWRTLTPLRKIVITGTIKIASSGTLAAGANGYGSYAYTVPAGYKTTGIITVVKGHPGTCYAAITSGGSYGLTGAQTGYYTYYNPKAVDASYTDFVVNIECTNTTGNA